MKSWIRFGLGAGQMFGAVVSLTLLVQYGLTDLTLAAVVATCILTTVSVLLFGRGTPLRRPKKDGEK